MAFGSIWGYGLAVSAVLGASILPLPVFAQQAEPRFSNPPVLEETRPGQAPMSRLRKAQAPVTSSGRRQLDLTVKFIENGIYNPATGVVDKVRLRGYTGAGVDPKAPYVAPVIEAAPGERITVALHNDLPEDASCAGHGDMNQPHCFNGTNLHSHGLWVSPTGNSDNVLISINPGKSFTYFYDLPDEHPAGTFWYHSHRHGSTALQVSSGMAGALVVRGDRPPTQTANGDLDTLLKEADGQPMQEQLLVFQQIQYACFDTDGKIKTRVVDGKVVAWICDPGDTGEIRNYDQFGPQTWGESGRYTTINGLVQPRFSSKVGQVERWRMIHGGVRETLTVAFRPRRAGAPVYRATTAEAAAEYVRQNCAGEPIPYHLVAADGLTTATARSTLSATLQPGYRFDALVVFPTAGDYCVVNEPLPSTASVTRADQDRQLLATVSVAAGSPVSNIDTALTDALVAAAERAMPDDVKPAVIADLKDGLKLTRFVPHPDVSDDEITGTQELVFFIDLNGEVAKFEVGNKSFDPKNFDPATFKPRSYDPNYVDRALPLGGVEEWTLQSAFVGHPFHIHVNPFQIVEILDPNGVDVSAAGAVDNAGGTVDPQYPGLKGVWKDTLWVKSLITNPADFPAKLASSTYKIKIRTRYERFIGEYVLHCHILDHEDQGMMQNVCIELPDGGGGANCARLLRPADGQQATVTHH
ncbi:multicopper oxidase domain-containing protein [Agrobacterium rhizogenes]|nr:multicopper oxidase domain-containing protein [Rhizobium rhizogenes]